MPADPRLNSSPLPLIVHIVGALGYAVLGAFQFSTACVDVGLAGTGRRDVSCWCSGWRSPSRRCG